MPQALQQSLMQHALDVGRFWLQNATLNRGVPDKPPRIVLGDMPSESTSPPVATTQSPIAPAIVPPQPPSSSSGMSDLAKLGLVLAATLGSGGLGGAALSYFLRPDQQPPTVQQPSDPQQPLHPIAQPTGSLLQYLEDKGYHLPAGERK